MVPVCRQTDVMGGTDSTRVIETLRAANRVLVTSHSQPDGDAVGSMAAMAHLLGRMGKAVMHYNTQHLPQDYRQIDLAGPWIQRLEELGDFQPDLLVVLDCGDPHRAGPEMAALIPQMPSVNIDHHLGNSRFGTAANWVDPTMAATCQMLGLLACEAGFSLDSSLGEAVYLGLNTDTGSFCYESTTPEVFFMAGEIVRQGLSLGSYFNKFEKQWGLNRLQLWGWLMQRVELHENGRVALSVILNSTLGRFGANRADLERFASFLQCIQGVEVTLLVRENGSGRAKASLRSTGNINVRDMAAEFGGGGHRNAAGAEFAMNPQAAAKVLLKVVASHLALGKEKG